MSTFLICPDKNITNIANCVSVVEPSTTKEQVTITIRTLLCSMILHYLPVSLRAREIRRQMKYGMHSKVTKTLLEGEQQ